MKLGPSIILPLRTLVRNGMDVTIFFLVGRKQDRCFAGAASRAKVHVGASGEFSVHDTAVVELEPDAN